MQAGVGEPARLAPGKHPVTMPHILMPPGTGHAAAPAAPQISFIPSEDNKSPR
jgi:hypothetical protein